MPGPIQAVVEKVIDGDTLRVRARIWIGQEVRVLVRINGVDTPELSGRCDTERVKAKQAKKFVFHEVGGKMIELTNIQQGKYAGRVIADIRTSSGKDLGAMLLNAGFAKPYAKRRYQKWCCPGGKCKAGSDVTFTRIRSWFSR